MPEAICSRWMASADGVSSMFLVLWKQSKMALVFCCRPLCILQGLFPIRGALSLVRFTSMPIFVALVLSLSISATLRRSLSTRRVKWYFPSLCRLVNCLGLCVLLPHAFWSNVFRFVTLRMAAIDNNASCSTCDFLKSYKTLFGTFSYGYYPDICASYPCFEHLGFSKVEYLYEFPHSIVVSIVDMCGSNPKEL